MSAIYKREFRSYFTNMTGFIFLAVLFLFSGIFTTAINLIGGSALYEYTLNNMSFVLMIIIPVLAMRSVARELHGAGTDCLNVTTLLRNQHFYHLPPAELAPFWLEGGATPIVCLPHRLVITLVSGGSEDALDAVSG